MGAAHDAALWAAVLLISGFVTFIIGAARWKFDYQAALPEAMAAWHRDAGRMRWIHSWMITATVVAVLGLVAFREMQTIVGERLCASIGLVLWVVGAVLMVVALVWRMTILADAAARRVEQDAVPEGAAAQAAFGGWVFWIHIMLSHLATIFLAISVLESGSLASWVGWTGIAIGALLFLGNAAQLGPAAPPILVHLWFLIVGIAILIDL